MKRYRVCIILICLVTVFFMSAVISHASDYTKYSTYKTGQTTSELNVRASASKSGTIIKTVDKGTKFTLFGYKKADGMKWYRVTYNGKAGYISSSYVKLITALKYVLYTPSKKGQVNETEVNIRKGPGTSYGILGTQKKGTVDTLKGYRTASGKKWYRITYDGKAGYICSDYVTLLSTSSKYVAYSSYKTVKAGTSGAAVRKEPSGSSSRYMTLSSGDKITVRGYIKTGDVKWYRVYYNGNKAYVKASSVKIVDNLPYIIYTPYKTGKVLSDGAAVRKGPGTSYEQYGRLDSGTKVTLKGYSTISGVKWYRITYDGNAAYIKASSVSICDTLPYTVYTPEKGAKAGSDIVARKGKSTSYASAGTIDKGAFITIKGYVADSSGKKWYRITYNENAAYIAASSVSLIDLAFTAYTPYIDGIVIADADARKTASTDGKLLGTIKMNATVTLKGYTYDSNGSKWYRTVYNGKAAFVKSDTVIEMTSVSAAPDETSYLIVNSSTLNVRSGPGTSFELIGTLSKSDTAEIVGIAYDSSNKTWYKLEYNGKIGYVHGDYVTVSKLEDSSDFEAYMTKQGFPESYKPYLRKLHAAHPTWIFKAQKTGISWDTAVSKETTLGTSLYEGGYDSWKSMEKGSYDFNNKKYVTFDGKWYNAYSGLTKYYLDPRNYLNEKYIYAFLDQSFDADTQSISSVKKMVDGSFLDNSFPESTYKTYSSCIYYAAKAAGMNANVLASMIIQEQGWKGTSSLISGTYCGYKGYYNYLNIGACTTTTMTAVQRGLWYAKQMGWNSRAKSIKGGAAWYAEGYIQKGQNTLYLKKFNVMNGESNVGKHQYMTNVEGAAGEGSHMKAAYDDISGGALVFSIPVFKSMPDTACKKPATKGNNNNLLNSLKVTGYSFDSSFTRYDQSYVITVPSTVKSVNVTASANCSDASVTGTGTITLSDGTSYIKVNCTSTSGLVRTYTITVKRK